jgi:hypothetical protein
LLLIEINMTHESKVRTTISIDPDLLELCKEEAEADHVSLSAWISRVLAWEINHCKRGEQQEGCRDYHRPDRRIDRWD